MKISFKLLSKDARLPTRANASDAGFDLYAIESITIKPKVTKIISLGISSMIPKGHFVSIRDRSSIAAKYSIHSLAGVIDQEYIGEWKVILANLSNKIYKISKGDRVAQGILLKLPSYKIVETKTIAKTARGKKGFGSSGK